MTTQELMKAVSKDSGIAVKDVRKVLSSFTDITVSVVRAGEDVSCGPLGTFKHSERKSSISKNIATGEPMEIPATTIMRLSPSKKVKDRLNNR